MGNLDPIRDPISIAIRNRDISTIAKALKRMDPNDGNMYSTYLTEACKTRDIDIVRLFVEAGANVNHYNIRYYTPIHIAILFSDIPIIKLLVESGADMDIKWKKMTPLDYAKYLARHRYYQNIKATHEVVKYLESKMN